MRGVDVEWAAVGATEPTIQECHPMRSLIFDSTDLGATEQFLSEAYAGMRISSAGPKPVDTHISRDMLGEVSLDRIDLGFDMRYDADPLEQVCLCVVESGSIEEHYHDTGTDIFGPGDVGLLAPPDLAYSGVIHAARYTITMFDPGLLDRVAASVSNITTPVRFTGHRPVTASAARQLGSVIDHLRQLAGDPQLCEEPLIVSTATQYLVASVLHALPCTAYGPSAVDHDDVRPETLRRALGYLESHVHDDIGVADIAAAASVTVRALQLAFRRHLDTTPTRYLRRLRLRGAHEQLRHASSTDGDTVTAVAAHWGFPHPGRFATVYREMYGEMPHTTLYR
ncbi:helix-turn-helix domain-containing protein [Nocardia sp. 004]|uniref:helix-turn-helix transcriptional regulator n=1 Tax=Nocardia sp. 004 TaxID=3385978 RepID=UPI0039A28060